MHVSLSENLEKCENKCVCARVCACVWFMKTTRGMVRAVGNVSTDDYSAERMCA